MRPLILASTSPFRQAMLKGAGVAVRAEPSGFDEDSVTADSPDDLVRLLAKHKACRVARRYPDALVIGADQVAVDVESGAIHGKPPDPVTHLQRLQEMRGRAHDLITGVCLAVAGEPVEQFEVRTRMHVRDDLTDAELVAYVASGEGSQCAGGYAAEGHGAFLFERIDGDWFNVIGLPLHALMTHLRARGWRYGRPDVP